MKWREGGEVERGRGGGEREVGGEVVRTCYTVLSNAHWVKMKLVTIF